MSAQAEIRTPDPRAFRDVMGVFATGVAVITTETAGVAQGMTVNSLTSLSAHPPMLLVCLTEGTRTARAVTDRGAFVVNLLGRGQRHLSDRFAAQGREHFDGLTTTRTDRGMPRLAGCAGYLECDVDAIHPGGDHIIVVGRVTNCHAAPSSPLLFYRGRYHRLAGPGHDDIPFAV
ncbi:flavin reductase family protein [Nocardia sp. NPDC003963]